MAIIQTNATKYSRGAKATKSTHVPSPPKVKPMRPTTKDKGARRGK